MIFRTLAAVGLSTAIMTGCSSSTDSRSGSGDSPVSQQESASESPSPVAAPESSAVPQPDPELRIPTADASKYWFSGTSTRTGPNSGYFFQSPSGKWICAIVDDFHGGGPGVGCEGVDTRNMPVHGAPLVPAADIKENMVQPSSIVMMPGRGPEFIKLGQPNLVRPEGPTPVLNYGYNLTALGFTCNTKESGISCRNDQSGEGFTFSTKGYTFEYTPVEPVPVSMPAPPADPSIVLGAPSDEYSAGYGTSRPTDISTNGLCGNTIHTIVWETWGEPVAYGTGTWCQPSGSRARGETPAPVTLTVSDIGDCRGRTAYRLLQIDAQPPTSICGA